MAPTKSRASQSKRAHKGAGVKNSKIASQKHVSDGIVHKKKRVGGAPVTTSNRGRPKLAEAILNKKKRTYSEKELGIPQLNMITPIGVVKPPGKKKGKEFVDDQESMATIMAIVQAEKNGQIESKIMKSRQMEEVREARRVEAEKKEKERQAKLEETKDSLKKKRRRKPSGPGEDDDGGENLKAITATSTKAQKPKKKKKVSFT